MKEGIRVKLAASPRRNGLSGLDGLITFDYMDFFTGSMKPYILVIITTPAVTYIENCYVLHLELLQAEWVS